MIMKPLTAKPASTIRWSLIAGLLLLPAVALAQRAGSKPVIQVRKTPGCGRYKGWPAYLRNNRFDVIVHDIEGAVEVERKASMSERYVSCRTGIVQDYVLESHVPARETKRLLQERPKAIELVVLGMSLGAPDMDGPVCGNRHMPYNTLSIGLGGQATVLHVYS